MNKLILSSLLGLLRLLVLILILVTNCFAGQATLIWDANTEPDLLGYKVYYSIEPDVYSTFIDVGNVTEYTIKELRNDVFNYFVVTAYDTEGLESDYSNMVYLSDMKLLDLSKTQMIYN